MTPEELTSLLTQGGTFKVPLSYPIFQAIRAMTEEQAQEIVNAHDAKKDYDLLARKDALIAELQQIQIELDAKGDSNDELVAK